MSDDNLQAGPDAEAVLATEGAESGVDDRPKLYADKSFWGMVSTQFLGAFNDNLYKQLMLLLAIPPIAAGAAAAANEGQGGDIQGWATLVFSLPFVLLSGFAGYLSDRFSKQPIIVLCKITEIVVMLLGLLAFYYFGLFGTAGTWIVLFLMGTQSTFFGPGKYGILPELFREEDLPRANGIMVMTTFLAIIFGIVFGGKLYDLLVSDGAADGLWVGLLVCIGIAILGTITSLFVRRVPPANPDIKLTKDCFALNKEIAALLRIDKPLLGALLVSSVFWLVSGITAPTVNRLGLTMLGADATQTSALTASIAFGIMGGALGASVLCRKGLSQLCVKVGMFGVFGSLVALGAWQAGQVHLLGYWGSVAGLVLMGVFAALFAIPIQVFLQSRPPVALKGRMIATMNQANFIGILISGPLYQLFENLASWLGWPVSAVFWMMAALMLPVAMVYNLEQDSAPETPAPAAS